MRWMGFVSVVCLAIGCSSNEATEADAGPCASDQVLAYVAPGCGADAPTACIGPTGDACLSIVCTCAGEEIAEGCGWASQPFRAVGPCDGDGGGDANDASTDDADASLADGDANDGAADADAGPCGPGTHVAYATPGCDATPTCLPDGPEDACASTFCDCTGKTIVGACGYATVPFASASACPEGDAATD